MTEVSVNKQAKLSEHFTLAELCKTSAKMKNVPNEAQVENLKRLCGWLEMLRSEWNRRLARGRWSPWWGKERESIALGTGYLCFFASDCWK